MSFVHLHLHTTYSICDGITQVGPLFKKAKASGQTAVALTDHGNMFGAVDFYKKAKANDIKPIIGSELYIAKGAMSDKNGEKGKKGYSHLVLLAKNEQGYKNLVKLSSIAYTQGFYYKPRIDKAVLYEHREGLICLSACIGGSIQQLFLQDRINDAVKEIEWYHNTFKDDFYLEIQNHGIDDERRIRNFFSEMSQQKGIPLVATIDVHYLNKEDAEAHEVMLNIGSQKELSDPTHMKYDGSGYHFMTEQEVRELFFDFPNAVDITQEIANKVNFDIDLKTHHFPKYEIPNGYDLNSYLEKVVYDGAKKRFGNNISPEIDKRLQYELGVIKQCGFSEYFLVVQDFVNWARERGIAVGPGRGCLIGSSPILLENGCTIDLKNTKIGDFVLTKDGTFQRVKEKFEYDCNEELMTIYTYYGDAIGITLTKDHEVYSEECKINPKYEKWDKSIKRKNWTKIIEPTDNLEWKEAEKLKVGDWVYIPKPKVEEIEDYNIDLVNYIDNNTIQYDDNFIYEYYENPLTKKRDLLKTIKRRFVLDEKWFKIFGIFAGDGWLRKRHSNEIGFVFFEDDISEKEFVENFFREIGCKVDCRPYKRTIQVLVGSKIFFRFFKSLFCYYNFKAQTKHIPEVVIRAKVKYAESFMQGLLFADGNYSEYKNVLSTTSSMLADQSRFLGLRCGILSSKGYDNRKDKREEFKNAGISYRVNFALNEKFGGRNSKSIYCYREINDGYLVRIRKIEIGRKENKVYDIRVENNSNYCTSSFLVHNSGAGSMVVYCLYITDVNPIEYDLFFERFLNPERVSMPDIDIDFCFFRRQEVIEYVVNKYGKENVSSIITFGMLGAKSVINAVAKVMGMSFQDSQKISKMVLLPTDTLAANLDANEELKKTLNETDIGRRVLGISTILEGCIKYSGIHASGIVVAGGGIDSFVPLAVDKEGQLATQYDMESVDAAGMLKVDFLGLRTMTVVNETIRLVKMRKGINIDINNIPLNDPAVYKSLAKGETAGVFQLESHGMRKLLNRIGLDDCNFRDLIALVALYRPGPLNSGMTDKFINRKRGYEPIVYVHPGLKQILDETYGVIVYQEQIMQIAVKLCGFTMGRGDVLRKAMGKKKKDVMDAMREEFVNGGMKTSGLSQEIMTQMFNEIEQFAAYGFNKSHSTCYALIAYWTAWLKVNYTVEFMASLLTSVSDKEDKVKEYFIEARRLNIPILLPNINESYKGFKVTCNGEIRYGMSAVRNLGDVAVEKILEVRNKEGRFVSIENFCSKVKVGKKVIESLIKCGAFDCMGNRPQLIEVAPKAVDMCKGMQNNDEMTLLDFDDEYDPVNDIKIELPKIPDWTLEQKGKAEKEILGLSISYNPLDLGKGLFRKSIVKISTLEDYVGSSIEIPVIVNECKSRNYSKGVMLILELMDDTGSVSAVVFDKARAESGQSLLADNLVIVSGRVDNNDGKVQILIDKARIPTKEELENSLNILTITVDGKQRMHIDSLRQLLLNHNNGDVPVQFLLNGQIISSDVRVSFSESLIVEIKAIGFQVQNG